MFRFLVVALLLWNSGGSAFAQSARPAGPATKPPAELKQPAAGASLACQLGLISIVGNKFEMTNVGPLDLAFMVKYSHGRADWGLDDLVFARVRAAAHGLTVRNIAYDKNELLRAAQERGLFTSFATELRDFARKVAVNTHCDRYIVIYRRGGQIDGRPATAVGFGAIRLATIGSKDTAYLYVLTSIRIYDKNFELIKTAPALIDEGPRPFEFPKDYKPIRGPAREIDAASLPATPQQAAQNSAFRTTIESLLAASLDKTLPGLLR